MANDPSLYFKVPIPDPGFPIIAFRIHFPNAGIVIPVHWQDHMQISCVFDGNGLVRCKNECFPINKGDIFVINSNEIYSVENHSEMLVLDSLIIDISLIESANTDNCQVKYIVPLSNNLIVFKNNTGRDDTMSKYVAEISQEYYDKAPFYEMSIKGSVFNLLTYMLRRHIEKTLTQSEFNTKVKIVKRFDTVFKYIDENYAEKITIDQLAKISCTSVFHFCRQFKEVTGITPSEYINHVRLEKAEWFLKNSDMSVTEIATATGFNNLCYFSGLFKKLKNYTPSQVRSK